MLPLSGAREHLKVGRTTWINASTHVANWRGGWRYVRVVKIGRKWITFKYLSIMPGSATIRLPLNSEDHYTREFAA